MSELESILNYLETTSMEPHDDYTSEFSYKEQKVLWKYIKQLQQENQELKKQLHEASIEIQHLIEQDIDCPSSCNKLEELKEQLEASRRVSKHHLNRELDLENQQKEFIEWLVKMSKDLFQNEEYGSSAIYGYILSKYKEIIGCKE